MVSGEGAPARRACLLCFFLSALPGIKSRAPNSSRHKPLRLKRIQKHFENLTCGFESFNHPPADDQLWQAKSAQNSTYVPPTNGFLSGAAGARFSGGRIAENPKMPKMKFVALIELFRMVQVRRASSAWLRRYEAKQLVGGTFFSDPGSYVKVTLKIEKLGHRVPKKLEIEIVAEVELC